MSEHSEDAEMPIKRASRAEIGRLGEDAAIEFYRRSGYRLLARNWRAGRFAEVDLILTSPSGLLIFAEVKTRRSDRDGQIPFNTGFESVGWRKRQKIVTAARIFMSKRARVDIPCRFDVLLVSCGAHGKGRNFAALPNTSIMHVPDAFAG